MIGDDSWWAEARGKAPAVLCTSRVYRTCRFCGEADDDCKLKYGVRHYVHPECYAFKYGRAPFASMHQAVLSDLPVFVLRDACGIDVLALVSGVIAPRVPEASGAGEDT